MYKRQIEDSKKACEMGGGQQILDFYAEWYQENKDSLITDEERYAMLGNK